MAIELLWITTYRCRTALPAVCSKVMTKVMSPPVEALPGGPEAATDRLWRNRRGTSPHTCSPGRPLRDIMNRITAIRRAMQSLIRAMRIRNGSLRRGDGGQSLVEFALVAPVLLVVLTGIFSFGIILNQYEVLTNATSAGARAFALDRGVTNPPLSASDPCAYAIQILEADAPNLNSSSLTFTITYTNNSTSPAAVSTYTTSCAGLSPTLTYMHTGDQVQVQVTYPVVPMVFKWATRSLTLSASATELVN